ncbi:hypothetical protein PENSTE_c012G08288 [Penicillium steckii]|uniref:Uncharacterized protein n=1 Tax=Penicillium steckii TaxID=303698 RepID=A0A1V6T4L0_9EURO|nr:hypothetical protein PENSTE_c012G08288 [Penicillium steckii]
MHGVIKANSAGLRHADGRWSQVICSKREALRPPRWKWGREVIKVSRLSFRLRGNWPEEIFFFSFSFVCFGVQHVFNLSSLFSLLFWNLDLVTRSQLVLCILSIPTLPVMIMASNSEASIVRIAGAGFRLSLLLNAAACQLAQSRIEIHSIAKGISLFALTLKHLGQALEVRDLDCSVEATEKAWEIASQGQLVFVEIEHMLDMLQGTDTDEDLRRIPVQDRLRWCFRKQHVTYLLAHLESLKLSLIVLQRILQLGGMLTENKTGSSSSSPVLGTEDLIAQEKAEAQNMIIVRYWSVRRLDRLWDMVEQEASEALNDQISQKIHLNYTNTASALKPLVAATKGNDPTKLHIVTLGDSEVGLKDLERSPKDMVHLSEKSMNCLLKAWIPSLDPSKLHDPDKDRSRSGVPRAFVSSDHEDEPDELDFDEENRGYYLEGNTVDWRKPQSQEARAHAAQLRQQYSDYQARVDSDSESDEPRRYEPRPASPVSPVGQRVGSSSDEAEQRGGTRQVPKTVSFSDGRKHSSSVPSRNPPGQFYQADGRTPGYPSSFPPPPPPGFPSSRPQGPPHLQSQPAPTYMPGHPPPQSLSQPFQQLSYRYHPTQEYNSAPRSIPTSQPVQPGQPTGSPSKGLSIPSPRGTPPGQYQFDNYHRTRTYSNSNSNSNNYNNNNHMLQPRHHQSAYPLSSSSPESSFRPSPPRSGQRSPSHSHRRSPREESRREEGRDGQRDRRNLTRNATRGLAGIGAIAGFMDALEAFSI